MTHFPSPPMDRPIHKKDALLRLFSCVCSYCTARTRAIISAMVTGAAALME